MPSRRDSELQRYFDGELSPRRARAVRRRIASDPAEQRKLDALGQMRDLLRAAEEQTRQDAAFEGLWVGVRRGIAAEAEASAGRRALAWLRRYRVVAASAVTALVIAVLALSLLPGGRTAEPVSNACVIESLEVGSGAVSTIFTITTNGNNDDATTVIWVSDAEEGT